jgi:hypothetical protein
MEVSAVSVGDLFGPDAVSGMSGPQNGSFILAVAGSHGSRASDSGVAFTFHAKGLQAGSASIECQARVSEGLNTLQSIHSRSSTMTIAGVTPTPNVSGSASIDGQVLASKPVTIRLYNADNSIAATTTTNPDGSFHLTTTGGTYTITASAEGFLTAQGSVTAVNGSIVTEPTVSLIAGDIDSNSVIDQMDGLTIRMNYNNSTPSAADLNNDDTIDVLDLGIFAENYGQSGMQVWQ